MKRSAKEIVEKKYTLFGPVLQMNVKKFLDELFERIDRIKETKNNEELTNRIKDLNIFLNDNSKLIYDDDLLRVILQAECKKIFNGCYICLETEQIINDKSRINYKSEDEPEKIIDHIAQKIRYNLFTEKSIDRFTGIYRYDNEKIDESDCLFNRGREMTKKAIILCRRMELKAEAFMIDNFSKKRRKHAFAIIEIKGKKYLLDCTYKQFFGLKECIDFEDLAYNRNVSPLGEIMLQNSQSKDVAVQLLKYGWIEATKENLEIYLSGFKNDYR